MSSLWNRPLGKSIGSYFRGIERGIADRAVPALAAAAGNDGTAKNSVELAPDELAWFGADGMAVHKNDIHARVVLFHLGLKPEILIAFWTGLIGKRTTRPIAIKPRRVSLFIAEAATDFSRIIRAVDFRDGHDIRRALDAGGLEGAGLTSVASEDSQVIKSIGKKTRNTWIKFSRLGFVGEPSSLFGAHPDFCCGGVV